MIGEIFSERYLVRERLAAGRFLSTYEAEDTELGTLVLVDILEAGALPGGLGAERLEEILDAAAQVRGERIASLYEWGRAGEDGPYYMVSERVEGASLLDILAECGEMPSRQVVEVVRASVEALAEAYGKGLFYIGLNPGQVVVRGEGDVRLIRVGYGWILEESEPLLSQRVSPYRAPETDGGLEGKRTSDVYALATMIGSMLPRESVTQRLQDLLETATDPLPRNRPSSPRLVLEELEESVLHDSPSCEVVEAVGASGAGGLSFLRDTASSLPLKPASGRRRVNMLRNLFFAVVGGLALWLGFAAIAGVLSGKRGPEEQAPVEEEGEATLPDLQGFSLEEAQEILHSLGLEYECRRAPSRLWSAGRVAAQDPPEGSRLRRGERVTLVVSSGREGVDAGGSDADGTGSESAPAGEAASPATVTSGQEASPPQTVSAGEEPVSAIPTPRTSQKPGETPSPPSPPRAVLTLSARSGAAPLCVSMDAGLSYDPDGDIVRYVWYCGDGTVLEGIAVQHVFDPAVIPARFQVVLEVFDSRGSSSSASLTLEVY